MRRCPHPATWLSTPAVLCLTLFMMEPDGLKAAEPGTGVAYVPAGEFLMGTPEAGGGLSDERPQRKIFLNAYWIDLHEVTNRDYLRFIEATGHPAPAHEQAALTLWEEGRPFPGSDEHPVVNVSWNEAVAYCRWAGTRLPTEAEWEKAARGTDGRRYPWGNEWDLTLANSASFWAGRTVEFRGGQEWQAFWVKGEGARIAEREGLNGEVLTLPVGRFSKGKSPYGLVDMAGNVSEWVADFYNPYYYLQGPLSDPPGPAPTILKTIRGGSWLKPTISLRTSDRDFGQPDSRLTGVGFRCARDDR